VLTRTTPMMHFAERHPLHGFNIAFALAAVWGSLALAAAVYDIGRWIAVW